MPIFDVLSKNLVVILVIFVLTRPISIKCAQNVGKILPLNIFESKWRY